MTYYSWLIMISNSLRKNSRKLCRKGEGVFHSASEYRSLMRPEKHSPSAWVLGDAHLLSFGFRRTRHQFFDRLLRRLTIFEDGEDLLCDRHLDLLLVG